MDTTNATKVVKTTANPEAVPRNGYVLRFPKIRVMDNGQRILTGSLKAQTGQWTAVAFNPVTGEIASQSGLAAGQRGEIEIHLAESF